MSSPDPVWVLGVATGVLLVLLAGFFWEARRDPAVRFPRTTEVWHDVARRLGGKLLVKDGLYRIRFRWNDRAASLSQGTPIRFVISDGGYEALHVELVAGAKKAARPELTPLQDSPEIAFAGQDEAPLGAFLTLPVRRLLRDLFQATQGEARVEVYRNLEIFGPPPTERSNLARFAVLCLQFAQHVRLFAEQGSGVRVIEEGTSSVGQCQICGAGLEGVLVRCARCATPHHADCWEYTGTCSTYGCGEKNVAG
jgi:hypothetical protein